jgi:hypothetical protein
MSPPAATPIAHHLARTAEKYTLRSVDCFATGEFTDFHIFAGFALEQAMKARLAGENPAFIAPERDFNHAALLWKSRDNIHLLPATVRTVTGVAAFNRVVALESEFERYRRPVTDILSFRNGEAHLGRSGSVDDEAALVAFLDIIGALLRVPPKDFWGGHADFVSALVDETATKLKKAVETRLAGARVKLTALNADVFSAWLDEAERQARLWVADDDEALEGECPVCGATCLLQGENHVEFDVEFDHHDGVAVGATAYLEFRARRLRCFACELELETPEELEEAGLDTRIPNESANVDDYTDEAW